MYAHTHTCIISLLPIRLRSLQEKDDEIAANEKAKNSLESHIFEMRDKLEREMFVTVSTEEQRGTIRTALLEAFDWLEEEGYIAETKVHSAAGYAFTSS